MTNKEVSKLKIRKEFVGIVTSDKMQKTVVVEVTNLVRHGQ